MYCYILKDCVPPKKLFERGEFIIDGKVVELRFIGGIGQNEAIKHVINFLIESHFIKPKNEESYNLLINNANKTFKDNSPFTLVVVRSDFDKDFPYDLLLALSLFQGYPAKLFALINVVNNKPTFKFYPDRVYKYSNNTFFLPDTDEDYETIISNGKHNRYIVELLYEANLEQRTGLKIAKYFSLLEMLSQKFPGNYKLEKIHALFRKFQFIQPFVPKYEIDMSNINYDLSTYYMKKKSFTSMDIMYMYRNVVVHDGILSPPEFMFFLDTNNIQNVNKITPLEELEIGVNMIIKTILRDSIDVKKMHLGNNKY